MKIYKIAHNNSQTQVDTKLTPKEVEGWRWIFQDFSLLENESKFIKYLEDLGRPLKKIKSIKELYQQVKYEEEQRLLERQRKDRIDYEKRKEKRLEEEKAEKEFSRINMPFIEEFLKNNSFDTIMINESISREDTIKILIKFLQTLFNDFTTEIVLKIDPDEENPYDYVTKLKPDEFNELFLPYYDGPPRATYPKKDVIQELLQILGSSQFENFDQYIASFEYENETSQNYGSYFTKRQYDAEEEQKRQKEFEEDTKRYQEYQEWQQKKWEAYKKEKGLPEDYNLDEFIAEKLDIEDEGAWDPEMAQSYRNWVKEDPFEERMNRESFFKIWYANMDWTYVDDDQQQEYWNQKQEQQAQKDYFQNQNNTQERERQERERQEKAKKSSGWKTIDDMLVFAETHGIDFEKLNPKDFREYCKKIYRRLSHHLHPDKYTDQNKKKWAHEEFTKLQNLWNDFKTIHKIAHYNNWYKTAIIESEFLKAKRVPHYNESVWEFLTPSAKIIREVD